MDTNSTLNRREFLRTTTRAATTLTAAASIAPAILSAESSTRTIGVGCIGIGTRGGDLINLLAATPGVKVVAVSDVYGPHRQKGLERSRNPDAKAYEDYRDLLADPTVEAVVIATPDHWHCQMVLDAVKAGKDIYCEKGFARTLEEAKQMRNALKNSKVVFQLGHQARQATCALQAKEIIASGALGPITLVRTGRFKSTEPNHPNWRWYGYYDQWERPDPEQVRRAVNWDLWLGPAPKIPWNERHFWHWRCYYAYGTGYAGDLLSHEMDFVQYLLGHGIPDTCVCSGLIALLRDDREVPDTWVAAYQFEQLGRTVTFEGSMNSNDHQPVTICGRDATLRFDSIAHDVSAFEIIPTDHNRNNALPKGYDRGKTPAQPNHMVDWLNCIRSRGTPKCSTDEAFIETATFLMSLKAQQEKRMVRWDRAHEQIV
ncbi:MAG TPA: Gfo/Idh/MocA family oxidoreductase [Verrucomicrobiota bacterium]|nr:Gfo/Idh/MocA family oxidoreductase [Verrucomicrobiota bacterium]HOK76834.1 Gfo/Idh/MocA family oxidoreductase [Verrucomicrobiota bacterium]HOK76837.1 Gfo/Idh/MocA family oxidoreductase [Verrucomicrobiota bacterium]